MIDDLPAGFRAGAAAAGFKKPGRDDLGLIFSEFPCELAAMFTRNLFRAAPVRIDQAILASGKPVRAIVANSGQANSCTGEQGLRNCREIQRQTAGLLGILPDEVLLLSTGVIGAQFDMGKWDAALP
ncbi:MAG: bifunctional ornithine acetyltransferase/N-acetylglutamate synthase, partial [Desulfovibrio sp.]|nr:bifunctional ornithine acetyltransferase/N-acetylglutamate synthase [Desulfovibrio sp.]